MDGSFQDYIEAEVQEILRTLDEDVKCDPDRLRRAAIAWIEKNAELFRSRWEQQAA